MDVLDTVREFQHRPWNFGDYSNFKTSCYTMLVDEEVKLLYYLTKKYYQIEDGEIIDAGSFLGGSTIALASGLIDSRKDAKVRSFDLFSCGPYEGGLEILGRPGEGSSFLDSYTENIKPVKNFVLVYQGNIIEKRFERNIGILFLDCLKSPQVNDFVVRSLFALLRPGRSILVQQDYIHEHLPWIHISMEVLKDYFVRLTDTDINSVVYLLTRRIPDDVLISACYYSMGLTKKRELHADVVKRWNGHQRRVIATAGVKIY